MSRARLLGVCGPMLLAASCASPTTTTSSESTSAPVGASLAALEIAEQPLVPAFSPTIHDYVVRCAAGRNTLTVRATAASGATAALVQPSAAAMGDGQAAALSVTEDAAIVVEARAGDGTSSSYWIRCLPHDFPALSADVHGAPSSSYYLLGNTVLGSNSDLGFAMILDGHGTPVWYRRTTAGACYVSSPGKNAVAYSPVLGKTFGTDPNGQFTIEQLDTGERSYVKTVGSPTDMHELVSLADGGHFVLSYPIIDGIDLSSRGIESTKIADCEVQEIAPDGTLAWSWRASDHFDVATESTDLVQATVDGDAVTDAFHCNALDVSSNGDVLVSSRHMDAVFLVSRATGKVVWKLGGVPSNKDGAQIVTLQGDTEGGFFHQHDARFLGDDAHLSMFDDHQTHPEPARGLELALDLATSSATPTWQYAAGTNAAAMGSLRRDSTGARLIGWGVLASSTLAFTDLDATGAPSLVVSFTAGDRLYRATKVRASNFDLDVLHRTAGGS